MPQIKSQKSVFWTNRRCVVSKELLLALLLIVLAGCNQAAPTQSTEALLPPAPEPDHPAPDFTLSDINGTLLALRDLRGRPVMVNFFATWCAPCRVEVPVIQAAYEEYKDQGLFIVGVDVGEKPETAAHFVRQFGLTYPIVLDKDGEVTVNQYKVQGMPASFFIDREGIIRFVHRGPITEALMESYLAKIF